MTRTFTDDSVDFDNDAELAEEAETILSDDNDGPDDVEASENAADTEAETDDTDDSDDNDDDAELAETPNVVWLEAVDNIREGVDNEIATFAARFVATGVKNTHEKLNELNNETFVSLARDNGIDPADKGRIMSEQTLFVEAVLAALPKRTTSGGTVSDPTKVAHDNAVRLLAIQEKLEGALENVSEKLREQCIVAGIVTQEDLDAHDNDIDADPWTPELDIDNVTFTKKFGESLEYIQSMPGSARQGGGASAGEDFSPGDIRFDNKGNSVRYDGTHYFVTLKGATGEQPTEYTSSSTAAKKEVTNCETNGKKHFRYDADPTV